MRVARHTVDNVCVRMQRRQQPPCTPLLRGERHAALSVASVPFDCQCVKACDITEEQLSHTCKASKWCKR